MKKSKSRVIAIDYFRGVCIILILLSHSASFTRPYAYFSGMGRLWIGSAAFFFLLSGLTLGIVRGKTVVSDFMGVARKSWKRAYNLYLIYILSVLGTILIYNLVPLDKMQALVGNLPATTGFNLLGQILTFRYSIGLANFLMFYAVYMVLAPFALYALYKYRRAWVMLPLLAATLYALTTAYPFHVVSGVYAPFALWQLYFVLGLTLARFRVAIIGWFYGLNRLLGKMAYRAVTVLAGAVLAVSAILGFNTLPILSKWTAEGWLPHKLLGGYIWLAQYKPTLNLWLMDNRMGLLRPLVGLLFLGAAYLIYQKHKIGILKYTGKFVTAMGRDTLWIFVAQAFVIPLMLLIPVINIFYSTAMAALLFSLMWSITQRRRLFAWARSYVAELKEAFYQGKYAAMYGRQDTT